MLFKYKAIKYYDNYESLAEDPEVDIIYIATPHTLHCENTLMCLEHNKAVLCEKPFAINSYEAMKMIEKAKTKNLFLMEAIWTRFSPHIIKALEILSSGIIGEIKMIAADFGFKAVYDPQQRLFNIDLGGGSLLDIGIYPLFLSLLILGKPSEIKANATLNITGADETCSIILKYNDSKQAVLFSTLMANTRTEAIVYGTNGFLHILPQWFRPSDLKLCLNNGKSKKFNFKKQGFGYQYEAIEAMNCLISGKNESDILPLSFSFDLINLLDNIRHQTGIKYKSDEIKY